MQKLALEEMAFEAVEVVINIICLGLFLAMIYALAIGVR